MSKKRGFTIIELIMVIVIIVILATIAIPRFINLRREAQKAACAGTGAAIRSALAHFYARRAIDQTAYFPRSVHQQNFLYYLAEGTLPPHPRNWDWNAYYDTWDAEPSGLGPRQVRFRVGQPPSSEGGACSGW